MSSENPKFKHLINPQSRDLQLAQKENLLGVPFESPIVNTLYSVIRDPRLFAQNREILTDVVDIRNQSEATARRVNITQIRRIDLPSDQMDRHETATAVEVTYSIPSGLSPTPELKSQLTEFFAREVTKSEQGTLETKLRNPKEWPKFCHRLLWDYDPVDKTFNRATSVKEETDYEGYTYIADIGGFSEPAKLAKRINPDTGTVIFIGESSDLGLGYRLSGFSKTGYSDDASGTSGIFLHQTRPDKVSRSELEGVFPVLNQRVNESKRVTKVTMRITDNGGPLRSTSEIEFHYLSILLSDILSGRVNYQFAAGEVGSAGSYYRPEISSIMAELNSNRYKNLSLDTLPGMEKPAQVITEHLIEPLSQDRLDDAQNIMLVGAPGTGKTALTTALSRMDLGVGFFSVSTGTFLRSAERITEELVEFHDRFGLNVILVLQDAEALFTNALYNGVEGRGAPVDPEKRQQVLELLNGERPTQIKFLLTINKPEYIDEALRRRFLMIYAPLPDAGDRDIYMSVARASLSRLLDTAETKLVYALLPELIAGQSVSYPQAFVTKLTEMVMPLLRKLSPEQITKENLTSIVSLCSQRLKNGYPIEEIRMLDITSRNFAAQTVSQKRLGFDLPHLHNPDQT